MRVLVTGGTGFLGRGIMRYMPENDYVIYSRDEYKQDLCRAKYPNATYVLGDIKDYDRLYKTVRDSHVELIIHTGAIKYIPEAEFNVEECIDVNIAGSRNVLRAAYNAYVSQVVGISTDKACQPVNVYGMTKAVMERLFGEYSQNMFVSLARYGNVIGSTGSVIPKFIEQLKTQKRITLTDPNMTRYWITINEAVALIREAMFCKSGSIIIPKPRSMTMQALADTLIAAYEPDAMVDIIGMRPGEKRHEALLHEQESVRAIDYTGHYELMRVHGGGTQTPFALSSESPQGGWLPGSDLLDAIAVAELV